MIDLNNPRVIHGFACSCFSLRDKILKGACLLIVVWKIWISSSKSLWAVQPVLKFHGDRVSSRSIRKFSRLKFFIHLIICFSDFLLIEVDNKRNIGRWSNTSNTAIPIICVVFLSLQQIWSGRDGDTMDDILMVQWLRVSIHGFPSFDNTYLFCCQMYFQVNQYWSHQIWSSICCLSWNLLKGHLNHFQNHQTVGLGAYI